MAEHTRNHYRKKGLNCPRQKHPRRDALIWKAWLANEPVASIAKRLRVFPCTIYKTIEREEATRDGTAAWIERAKKQRTFDREVYKLWNDKKRSYIWIAKSYGCSVNKVRASVQRTLRKIIETP